METSPNWNIEIVPGAKRVKRAADFVFGLVRFLPDTPLAAHGDHLPSEIREQEAAALRAEANQAIN